MKRLIFSLSTVVLLAACSDNDNNNVAVTPEPQPPVVTAQYEVTVSNLTAGQPFSPVTVFINDTVLDIFTVGTAASLSLEHLAESGDNSMLLDEIVSSAEASAGDPLPPGGTESLMLTLETSAPDTLYLSVITMLVNTNDATTAALDIDIAGLSVDETLSTNLLTFDNGTEANSESAGTIPGPAGGGEGFNETRDDINDLVTGHSGVVSSDDGLSGSALSQLHRWDNPAATISITRTR